MAIKQSTKQQSTKKSTVFGLALMSALAMMAIAPSEAQASSFGWPSGCPRWQLNVFTGQYELVCQPNTGVRRPTTGPTVQQCQNELNVLRRTTNPLARRYFEQAFLQNCRQYLQYLR